MRARALTAIGLATIAMTVSAPGAQAATVTALWHMGDAGAVMTDASGHGVTGTLTNVATGQPGAVGHAFGFAGRPSYVDVANTAALNPGTAAFTVAARVRLATRPSAAVGDFDIIRKGLASTPGGDWKVEILQSGRAFCLFKGSAGQVSVTGGPNLANNRWHSISCRRTSTGVRLIVDGTTYTKTGATGSIANASSTLIGAKSTTGEDQYAGLLDEVSVSTG
jgi:Concanavalin A-like lectin/glucanases superfamily